MIYRRFGKTDLQMPVVTCGAMRFQHGWKDVPLAEIPADKQANLEACVRRALELGINHVETARGYGSSERQLGRILPTLPRDKIIVQTKVAPAENADEFVKQFRDSLERLSLDHVDMLALHGVNDRQVLERSVRPGGCLAAARRLQREGKCRFVGFSTHGPTDVILDAVRTDVEGGFDYVNLHWYFIYPVNWPAIAEAARRDMGVLIISPNDKGGKLYEPPDRLCELTAPMPPMAFNDLFCLSRPQVHTISIGVARPKDFDLHVQAAERLAEAEDLMRPIFKRLAAALADAVPEPLRDPLTAGLPNWEETPGGVNIPIILWLRNLAVAYGMVEYGKMRYNLLGSGGHWFPGNRADKLDEIDLAPALKGHPLADRVPALLREAHELLGAEPVKRLSQSES